MQADRREPTRAERALGAFWVVAGTLHFAIPRSYERMMPRALPAHRPLVLASGVAEVAGGLAVMVPRVRRIAGWWLLAVTAAVYPANVQMALNPERYSRIPRWALFARLPLQGMVAWWVWRVCLRSATPE